MLALAAIAAAATPGDRLELFGESGVYTAMTGVGFGLDGVVHGGPLELGLSGTMVGRAALSGLGSGSSRPWVGLSTASVDLGIGRDRGQEPFGLVALLDAAALSDADADCVGNTCRHGAYVGGPRGGVGFQPAVGVRLSSTSAAGVRTSMVVAAQPIRRYDVGLLVPRLELTVWRPDAAWSVHAWTSRYGFAAGLGHALGRAAEDPR